MVNGRTGLKNERLQAGEVWVAAWVFAPFGGDAPGEIVVRQSQIAQRLQNNHQLCKGVNKNIYIYR